MPPVWTSKRVSSLSLYISVQAWVVATVTPSPTWVLHRYSDDLEVSYLDGDQNVVHGPVQVGGPDGLGHYDTGGASHTPASGVLSTYDVRGVKIHHRDPGASFPFFFSVSSVSFTPDGTGDGRIWNANDFYSTSEIAPTYEAVPDAFYPYLWVPEGFRTFMPRAVFDASSSSWLDVYPVALSGEALPVDGSWMSALNPSTGASVLDDVAPMPDPPAAGWHAMNADVPLGDLVIMFGEWTDPSRRYLRQRQSPRANPRVSFQRTSLRQRQYIP